MATTGTDTLTQFLPLLLLCCMLPLLMRGQQQSSSAGISTEMDIWFTGYTPQETYDSVIKTVDKMREKAMSLPPKKSRNPFSRNKGPQPRYVVDQADPPKLYKVSDRDDGPLVFEVSEAEGGGTMVKTTFTPRTRSSIQTLKTEMPVRKFVMPQPKEAVCSSCGKPRLPEWQVCPYCGNKYT